MLLGARNPSLGRLEHQGPCLALCCHANVITKLGCYETFRRFEKGTTCYLMMTDNEWYLLFSIYLLEAHLKTFDTLDLDVWLVDVQHVKDFKSLYCLIEKALKWKMETRCSCRWQNKFATSTHIVLIRYHARESDPNRAHCWDGHRWYEGRSNMSMCRPVGD